jgi:hypothetical protein
VQITVTTLFVRKPSFLEYHQTISVPVAKTQFKTETVAQAFWLSFDTGQLYNSQHPVKRAQNCHSITRHSKKLTKLNNPPIPTHLHPRFWLVCFSFSAFTINHS